MLWHTIMNGKGPPVIPLLFLPNNESGNGESAYLDQPALHGVIPWYRPHIPEDCIMEYIPDLMVASLNIMTFFNLFEEIFHVSRINNEKASERWQYFNQIIIQLFTEQTNLGVAVNIIDLSLPRLIFIATTLVDRLFLLKWLTLQSRLYNNTIERRFKIFHCKENHAFQKKFCVVRIVSYSCKLTFSFSRLLLGNH